MKLIFGGGLFGALVKSIFKKPKTPEQIKPVTRDDARDRAAADQELLRRRGGAADILTGNSGAEAPAGSKITLGS